MKWSVGWLIPFGGFGRCSVGWITEATVPGASHEVPITAVSVTHFCIECILEYHGVILNAQYLLEYRIYV